MGNRYSHSTRDRPSPEGQLIPRGPAECKEEPCQEIDFTELPTDLSRHMFEYLDLASLVKLAGCSKVIENAVYRQNRHLWEHIDFEQLTYKRRENFTDRSLHRLLDGVNAREVTKILSLRNCSKIEGFGLEPLRGSCVLEELDLRTGLDHNRTFGPSGLHDTFVLELLGTMLPLLRPSDANKRTSVTSALFVVRFRLQRDAYMSRNHIHDCFHSYGQLAKWMERFDGSLKDRIFIDRVSCDHCDDALVDKVPNDTFESAEAASMRCTRCKEISCGQESCPQTSRCTRCYDSLCHDCDDLPECDSCSKKCCSRCGDVDKCEGLCGRTLCQWCEDVMICGSCEKSYCETCRDVVYCEECDEWFCTECREVKWCAGEHTMCVACQPDPYRCARCDDIVCTDECCASFKWCDGCEDAVCSDCDDLELCGGCKGLFCLKCRDFSEECKTCCDRYCSSCQEVSEQCSSCQKCSACCVDVAWCSSCNDYFGSACRQVSECRDCGIPFCSKCLALSPCASCKTPLCPSCECKVGEEDNGPSHCDTCADEARDKSRDGEEQKPRSARKADSLRDHLCDLKLVRARARRKLDMAERKVEEAEASLRDAGLYY